jgi:hypothetical protein
MREFTGITHLGGFLILRAFLNEVAELDRGPRRFRTGLALAAQRLIASVTSSSRRR